MDQPVISGVNITHSDVQEFLRTLPDKCVDAAFGDPPYGLGEHSNVVEMLQHWLNDKEYDTKRGFMGAEWDVVPGPVIWRELFRVMKPGGVVMMYSGTRTADLLGVAIRLAGFEKFDEIAHFGAQRLAMTYGSGFPKSHDLSRAVDSAGGFDRKVRDQIRTTSGGTEYINRTNHEDFDYRPGAYQKGENILDVTEPGSELGEAWNGWGTALKPAREDILIFRKPFESVSSEQIREVTGWDHWHTMREPKNTPKYRLQVWKKHGVRLPPACWDYKLGEVRRKALHGDVESDLIWTWRDKRQDRNRPSEMRILGRVEVTPYRPWTTETYAAMALVYGTGALNIDGTRIAVDMSIDDPRLGGNGDWRTDKAAQHVYEGGYAGERIASSSKGRWPANVIFTHAPGCQLVGQKQVVSNGHYPASRGRGGLSTSGHQGQDGLDENYTDGETVEEWECVDGCMVAAMDQQGGILRSGVGAVKRQTASGHQGTVYGKENRSEGTPNIEYGDEGGASRFFKQFQPSEEEWVCVPECAVWQLEAQSGERRTTWISAAHKNNRSGGFLGALEHPGEQGYNDTGTAARFFAQFQPNIDHVVGNPPFLYTSKASSAERDFGLGEEYPEQNADAYAQHRGRRMPNGSDRFDNKPAVRRRNPHATVKPLSMNVYAAQYLATMLLPPAYRRDDAVLIVPFAGVWSEVIGAWLAGWRNIIGCEQNAEYMAVGAQRFDAWKKAAEKTGTSDPKEILRKSGNGVVSRRPALPPPAPAKPKKDGPVQLDLFG